MIENEHQKQAFGEFPLQLWNTLTPFKQCLLCTLHVNNSLWNMGLSLSDLTLVPMCFDFPLWHFDSCGSLCFVDNLIQNEEWFSIRLVRQERLLHVPKSLNDLEGMPASSMFLRLREYLAVLASSFSTSFFKYLLLDL